MQNYVVNVPGIRTFALIHQPIPFSNLSFFELEFSNWIKYNLLLKRIIIDQKKYINGVIVQTEWMKSALKKKFGYTCPIQIIRPPVGSIVNNTAPLDKNLKSMLDSSEIKLFYPTNNERYKNNDRLINAIMKYNELNSPKISLLITLEGNSNEFVKFIGKVSYDSIYNVYKNVDALIFPSMTETMGFPLLEAQQCGLSVLASDLPFAREICGLNALYFNPRDISSIVAQLVSFSKIYPGVNSGSEIFDAKNVGTYLDYFKFMLKDFKSNPL